MRDPVEIVAATILDHDIASGSLLEKWRQAHQPRALNEARILLTALHNSGWHIVRPEPFSERKAQRFMAIGDQWLPTKDTDDG